MLAIAMTFWFGDQSRAFLRAASVARFFILLQEVNLGIHTKKCAYNLD